MSYTPAEQNLINITKSMLPNNFLSKESDDKLLAYLNLVLQDVNLVTPGTSFDINSMPTTWNYMIAYGATIFANLFLQVNYALKDFNYSDYGLSLTIDRQGRLGTVHDKQLRAYERMIWNAKKMFYIQNVKILGFGSPRYQSSIGQFLKTVFGCLPSKEFVLTNTGYKSIDKINVGDFVISDKGNSCLVSHAYSRIIDEDVFELTIEDKQNLLLTQEHPILVKRQDSIFWNPAKNLSKGDLCYMPESQKWIPITNMQSKKFNDRVYNITVEGDNSFIASKIAVHNSSFNWGTQPNG